MNIIGLKPRIVYDSRGTATIEVDLKTKEGVFTSSAPSGISVGKHEAVYVDVKKAMRNIAKIRPKIKGRYEGFEALDKKLIELDGTENKSKLGGNTVLPISVAGFKAEAAFRGQEIFEQTAEAAGTKPKMPTPYMNLLNGGRHAGIPGIQEYMITLSGKRFSDIMSEASNVYYKIKEKLRKEHLPALAGDEGGFVIKAESSSVLDFLSRLYKGAIALDCAASEFYKNGRYNLDKTQYTPQELLDFYKDLVKRFNIVSLEDCFAQDAWSSWQQAMELDVQVVGDDLLATQPERVRQAVRKKACDCLLLKINQVGTISEALDAFKVANKAGWNVIVSHRSGETEDDFIADFSVGLGHSCKFGAPAHERNVKYNKLLRLEEIL